MIKGPHLDEDSIWDEGSSGCLVPFTGFLVTIVIGCYDYLINYLKVL